MIWLLLFAVIPQDQWNELDRPAQWLIKVGTEFPGARACQSEHHPALQTAAEQHARYQARVCRQGHQRWAQRSEQLARKIPGVQFCEICAESWDRQRDEPLPEIAREMYRCWKQSPGHWRVASTRHRYFGAAMAQGRNGIWYACIIVGD